MRSCHGHTLKIGMLCSHHAHVNEMQTTTLPSAQPTHGESKLTTLQTLGGDNMFGRGAALRAFLAAPSPAWSGQLFTAGSRYQIRASWGLFGRSLRQGKEEENLLV
jgi:hypothetical protein